MSHRRFQLLLTYLSLHGSIDLISSNGGDLKLWLEEVMIFRQVDLGERLDCDVHALIRHSEAIITACVEDIADCSASSEGKVWHLDILLLIAISCNDEHVAERVREEGVSDVALDIGVIPSLSLLPCLVNCGDVLVHVTSGVHRVPQTFPVFWIVSTTEALFVTVVEERDTSCSQSKYESVLELVLIAEL